MIKSHLTDKLLQIDLILGRDIPGKLGIIFNFKNKTISWQEFSIFINIPNNTAKGFFKI